jgi:hypothetical protein
MAHYDRYRIEIDGKWSLEDLYRFPRAYEQVYFALEAIIPSDDKEQDERIERAFIAFPWRGGYSAVNFYDQLKWATPVPHRPAIVSVKYASLGWIELFLNQPLAVQMAGIISTVAASLGVCNKVYNQIHSDLQKRKLLRMAVESRRIALSKEQIAFVKECADNLADVVGVASAKALDERTKDPLISLKILLSVYRRIRTLAEFKNRGKADFRSIEKKERSGDET